MSNTFRFLYKVIFYRLGLKLIVLSLFIFLAVVFANWYVTSSTRSFIYNDLGAIPGKKVAVVLGARRFGYKGYENPYFTFRMEAAAQLYHAGKVSHLLVSGDNHAHDYNEPEDMKQKLMELGVPSTAITMDFAGFRTFDSMIRAKEIFGLDDFIVVSQPYHLERAIYIAQANDIEVIGFAAKDVAYKGINLREPLAKLKAVLDCTILFTSPKFLGNQEYIQLSSAEVNK